MACADPHITDIPTEEKLPSLEDLGKWKVVELQEWLVKHNLKKSGNKPVLINRVYRAMGQCDDSDSYDDDISDSENTDVMPIHKVTNPWKTLDFNDIPPLEMKDVDNYFMYQKNPMTGTRLRFERQMKKAKRFCNEGFVRQLDYNKITDDDEHCYIRAECVPSMRTTVQVGNLGKSAKCYNLYVGLSKSSGYIAKAYCNCKAGEGGLCAHTGALLYTLVKTKGSCTSNECTWDRPRPITRKPSPKRLCDISFRKTENDGSNSTVKCKPYPGVYKAGPCEGEGDSDVFLSDLLDGLGEIYPELCVLYKVLRSVPTDLSPFLTLYSPPFMYMDNVDIKSADCRNVFESFLDNISIDNSMAEKLELGTRGQHNNINWKEARTKVITASKMAEVVKRRIERPDNLLFRLCGYDTNSNKDRVKSIMHGHSHEQPAIREYAAYHLRKCNDVDVERRGLYVNPAYPFLGASVDSQVTCVECGPGLVEIKCPYGSEKDPNPWRNRTPVDCCSDPNFCCYLEDGQLHLKARHNYMFQIQGQLAIYELDWVDFVVWTKKGISVERIQFNKEMWKEMLEKLRKFYVKAFIPELFTNRVKRGKSLF